MSTNKNKTFLVKTIAVVKANTKREAELAISRVRVPNTTIVGRNTQVDRIPASEAVSHLD